MNVRHGTRLIGNRGAAWVLTCLLLVLALAACAQRPAAAPQTVRLRIAGSSSMAPLLTELAEAYCQAHPDVSIEVRAGGSAAGLQALRAGKAELAAVTGAPLGHDETDVQAIPIARDGLTLVIHPDNPLRELSILQARSLYRGETPDWAALGGLAEEPVILSREEGSGDRTTFEAMVMGSDRVTLNAVVMPSAQAVVDYVAGHRNAVGYTSSALLSDNVRALAIEGILPDAASVRSGAYPLTRLVYLYAPEQVSPASQAFVDFVLGPTGQAIVARRYAPLQ